MIESFAVAVAVKARVRRAAVRRVAVAGSVAFERLDRFVRAKVCDQRAASRFIVPTGVKRQLELFAALWAIAKVFQHLALRLEMFPRGIDLDLFENFSVFIHRLSPFVRCVMRGSNAANAIQWIARPVGSIPQSARAVRGRAYGVSAE